MKKRISSALSYIKKHRPLKYAIITAVIILSLLIVELVISNAHTMFISKNENETDLEMISGEPVVLTKGESLTYACENVPKSVYAIRVGIKSESGFSEPISLNVNTYDKKLSNWYITVESTYVSPGEGEISYRTIFVDFDTGAWDYIGLYFSNISEDAELCSVVINPSDTFTFSGLRFSIMCLVALAVFNLAFFGLNREAFDCGNRKHLACALVTVALCVIITVVFCNAFCGTDGDGIEYPIDENLEGQSPYIQQTDAFLKGQLHLDIEVSKELLELENPYDTSARSDIYYLWDRAMYDGKYYSYFGIGPILNVYLPYYLLNGELPSDTFVIAVYAFMVTLFTCLFIYGFVIIYKKRVPVSLLSLAVVCVTVCSGALLMARSVTPFYYLAVIASMAYMAQFLFFILMALNCSHKVLRPVFFALASLSYGFMLLSRLNVALLCAFIVVPVVIYGVILNRTGIDKENTSYKEVIRTTKEKIIDLSCLGFFALAAVIFTLYYNYARFDSIFEFGTTYQLTVSDISQNSITGTNILEFLYHYFLQPFEINGAFPFFGLSTKNLNSYGSYWYVDAGMGLFAIPLMLALFLCIGLFKSKKKTGFAKCLTACGLGGAVIVCLMNFYIGGVIYRYTCDVTLLCAIMAVLFIFSFNERLESGESVAIAQRVEKILMVISIVVCSIVLVSRNVNLAKYDAGVFVSLLEAFS